MKVFQTALHKKTSKGEPVNGGYVDIHDDGTQAERHLFITDDQGNTVCLKNAQIGELYVAIKPGLTG